MPTVAPTHTHVSRPHPCAAPASMTAEDVARQVYPVHARDCIDNEFDRSVMRFLRAGSMGVMLLRPRLNLFDAAQLPSDVRGGGGAHVCPHEFIHVLMATRV